MTALGDTFWSLPGPSGFVRDIRKHAVLGRHVLGVLPGAVAEDGSIRYALFNEVEGPTRDIEQVLPDPSDDDVVRAIGLGAYIDNPPPTVRTLIAHEDLAGRTILCAASDFSERQQALLPEFLLRLETASRTVPSTDRCTFVIIAHPSHLPSFAGDSRSDLDLETIWFWNRVARWDVAALLDTVNDRDRTGTLLDEIRMETVIETARWDLNLAAELAVRWTGTIPDLVEHLCSRGTPGGDGLGSARRSDARRPPEALLDLWDKGVVDYWHGDISVSPTHSGLDGAGVDRIVWAAQARVLLPWIELRRERLATRLEDRLGSERFADLTSQFRDSWVQADDDTAPEIGTLARMIAMALGQGAPQLRKTAHALRLARNKLAHLRPLPDLEIRELIEQCHWLT